MLVNPKITDRFWTKVDRLGPDDCWLWTAYYDREAGYGRFGTKYPEVVWAHRYAYLLANGAIPLGLSVLHTCDNRLCCNPWHLFVGTHNDNMKDMVEKGRAPHRGERSWSAKLIERDVLAIRARAKTGEAPAEIANDYDIHPAHARAIIRRKFWAHV